MIEYHLPTVKLWKGEALDTVPPRDLAGVMKQIELGILHFEY